jgi:hypothetical protein
MTKDRKGKGRAEQVDEQPSELFMSSGSLGQGNKYIRPVITPVILGKKRRSGAGPSRMPVSREGTPTSDGMCS